MTSEKLRQIAQSREMLDLINMEAHWAVERIMEAANRDLEGVEVDGNEAYILTTLLSEEFKLHFTLMMGTSANSLMSGTDEE